MLLPSPLGPPVGCCVMEKHMLHLVQAAVTEVVLERGVGGRGNTWGIASSGPYSVLCSL